MERNNNKNYNKKFHENENQRKQFIKEESDSNSEEKDHWCLEYFHFDLINTDSSGDYDMFHWTHAHLNHLNRAANITDASSTEIADNDDTKKDLKEDKMKSELISNHQIHVVNHPLIVEKRNARERRRVKAVNEAFTKLRQMVPAVATRGKRVSKVKTLKKAVEYILELKRLLDVMEKN